MSTRIHTIKHMCFFVDIVLIFLIVMSTDFSADSRIYASDYLQESGPKENCTQTDMEQKEKRLSREIETVWLRF